MPQKIQLWLGKIKEIRHNADGTISIRFKDLLFGRRSRRFKPKQGLHLKEGDLVIRHETRRRDYEPPVVVAVDRVSEIKGSTVEIERALGNAPSIKGRFIKLNVFCE